MATMAMAASLLKFHVAATPGLHPIRISSNPAVSALNRWEATRNPFLSPRVCRLGDALCSHRSRRIRAAGGDGGGRVPDEDNKSLAWKLLRLEGWDVPWGYGVTMLGLCGWLASFLVTGLATAVIGQRLGINPREMLELDLDEQATYILFSQVLQTITGLGTIKLVMSKYEPLPPDLFMYDFKRPFDLQRGWLLWAGIGILCAGGAVVVSSMIVSSVNGELPPREEGDALSLLLPLIGVSPLSTASLIVVTGALAPLLEETVFRGFLLASLTKRLPVPVAVVLSSAAFALAHLTPGEFPQLFALGIVMGFAYSKTHNMLTPVLIHATWNSGVVIALTALSFQGYDLKQVLSS